MQEQTQQADIGGKGFDFIDQNDEKEIKKKYPWNIQFSFNMPNSKQSQRFKMTCDCDIGLLFMECQTRANQPIQTINWQNGPMLFRTADNRRKIKTILDENVEHLPTKGKVTLIITYKAIGGQTSSICMLPKN